MRGAKQIFVGHFAVVGMLLVACGGSTPAQRGDDDTSATAVDDTDVGGGEPADHSDAQVDDGTDGVAVDDGTEGLAVDDGPAADPVKVAVADTSPKKAKTPKRPSKFQPSQSPAKMSEFLVKPAKAAMKKRNYPRAVSLYSGLVAARGKGDPSALELAKAWNLAAQFDSAVRVYQDFAAATNDDKAREAAMVQVRRLRVMETPFQREYGARPAKKEAVDAFKRGRKAQKKKKWADALLYFQIAGAVDPSLKGVVREIGTSYGKLGAKDEKVKFLVNYLWLSPMGAFSNDVRKDLKKMKQSKKLGYLNVKSKLKCEEVWVVGQRVKQKLPIKKLAMAPGRYKWLCYAGKYAMALFDEVVIEAGKTTTLEFHWAILVNGLEKPWGRIRLEKARDKGTLMDLGLEAKELGIEVPKDGSALEIHLQDPRGTVVEKNFVRIAVGERHVVKWKKSSP